MKNLYLFLLLSVLSYSLRAQCWETVSAGMEHTIAIRSDGTLWAWGFNGSGQLGDGTLIDKKSPVQIGTAADWKSVSAGGNHSLAIKADGTLWAWGHNFNGQVGDGTFGAGRKSPVKIGTATDWKFVAGGRSFSLAIKTDGTLWAWGDNFFGQLGHGAVAFAPKQVGTATNWTYVSAGGNHTVALKADNTLWAWGLNTNGQLGDGTTTSKSSPTQIGAATDWLRVATGVDHTLAIKSNGSLWAWGTNDSGQSGNGTIIESHTPLQIGTSGWKAVAAGDRSSLAINANGTLWAWGYIIGGVPFGEDETRLSPTQLTAHSNWEIIATGSYHAFAFQSDETLWGWGDGTWGKLGDDTWADYNLPQNYFLSAPSGPSLQTFCEAGKTIASLNVQGTNIRWYNAPAGGTELLTSTPLVHGAHYYASQTKYPGCESLTRLDVEVSINTTPVASPTGPSSYIFCEVEMLEKIAVSGTQVRWFDSPTGGFELSPALTPLQDNLHFYASQTIGGCESAQRLDVLAIRNTTPAPTAWDIQRFCESATIADLQIETGTNIKWYADATGSTALPITTALVSGSTYYASSTVGSLESCTRQPVTAFITHAPTPTGDVRQPFCNSGEVVFLKATGTAISWYDVPVGGSKLPGFEAVQDGKFYYGTQTIDGCESIGRLKVQAVINTVATPAPTGASTQVICDQALLGDIAVNGQNIRWYWDETRAFVLSSNSSALERSYYASQTIDACESADLLKVTVSTNRVSIPDLPGATPWRARMVSGGVAFSVAIMEDGTLWSWGSSEHGALGNGTLENRRTPTMVSAETDWVSVHAGHDHVLALKSNGSLWAWGYNEAGQLGDGTATDRLVPTRIGTDTDWKMIAAGGSHTLALKNNGTLWSCGWNHYGQTGIVTDRGWPLIGLHQVGTANDWKSVAAGGSQSLAIKNDGTLWVWGKIGKGTNDGSTVQVKIPSDKPWLSIVAGHFHVLGIKTDGSLWAWGSNEYSQLGNGLDADSESEPSRVGTGNDWRTVSGGTSHTIAIKNDGTLWGWGQNGYSQVGVPLPPWEFKNPERISGDTDWEYINAGYEHNLAIRKDGSIWVWARNIFGQLGDGTRLTGLEPLPIRKDELYTCGSSTLADVISSANTLTWYDAAEGGNILDPATTIISGNYYYVSQTINNVESCYRKRVRIISSGTVPPAPTGNSLQTTCLGSKVSDLIAVGTNVLWYDVPSGGVPLTSSTPLVNGNHYYASQRTEGCQSATRLDVTVTLTTMDPPEAATQTLCAGATIAQLTATGTDIRWYATADAVNPLTPGTLLATNTYFVSQKSGSCESSRRAVSVVINPLPAAPSGNTSQVFCQASTVSNLVAEGVNVVWYELPGGGTALANSTALVNNKKYYASQQINGCVSSQRLEVVATITILSTPSAPLTQTFCAGATVANLTPNRVDRKWYATAVGGDPLAENTLLQSQQYFLANISGPCESPRRAITVTINSQAAPTGNASQSFCQASTISNLVAVGTNIKWYDAPTGGSALAASVVLITNKHYYASQTVNNCESQTRLDVTAIVKSTDAPTGLAEQLFCTQALLSDLIANGTGIRWYADATGGNVLPANTALVNDETYFASQTLDGCESAERLQVVALIKEKPAAPEGESLQVHDRGKTMADLAVSGTNIKWYHNLEDANAGVNPIPLTALLVHGSTYFATQTTAVCESDPFSVTVSIITGIESTVEQLNVQPNPVRDILTISHSQLINNIVVVNQIGQTVITKTINDNTAQLDMSALSEGVYFVEVMLKDKVVLRKVLKY